MGVVYKGYEPSLARFVAIKELTPALAHDPLVVERFLREARSMAQLNDPHIIHIYFIGQANDQPFFVMEFVDGLSLAELLKRDTRLPPGDAMKIVHQAAKGLAAAHRSGVIHRDIKPGNLIFGQGGVVKIADFGIALANKDIDAKLTSAGELVGTPGYLSPEVLLGNLVDQRSDVYALGVVLFEMLTGRTPFTAASVYKLMLDVVQGDIPDVRDINAEIDPGVAAILAKMLAKEPASRYQSMNDLLTDLEKHPLVARGGPISVRLAPSSASADTLIGVATPMTPGAARRGPAALPEASRLRQAPPGPISAEPGVAPADHTQVRNSNPGLGEAAPSAANNQSKRIALAVAAVLLILALVWVFRGPLLGLSPGASPVAVEPGNGQVAADRDAAPADASPSNKSLQAVQGTIAENLPSASELARGWRQLRATAIAPLRSLFRVSGIPVSADLVFNILVIVLVFVFVRSGLRSLVRWRWRVRNRAWARRAAQMKDGPE